MSFASGGASRKARQRAGILREAIPLCRNAAAIPLPAQTLRVKADIKRGAALSSRAKARWALAPRLGAGPSRPHAPPPGSALLQPIATRALFPKHALVADRVGPCIAPRLGAEGRTCAGGGEAGVFTWEQDYVIVVEDIIDIKLGGPCDMPELARIAQDRIYQGLIGQIEERAART